ncbi:MAG: aspartate aminotransferase family protein [Ferrovibrio sp.]|uniref:aspartate aminotransferase family protein n=1 Tax=Ferrovibrio sp. TaxID=1917215 RepID=UPI003918E35B
MTAHMPTLPNSMAARDIAHVMHPYTNLVKHETAGPLVIERGKGIYVYDDQGQEYIEGMAGLWCAGLGFSEAALVDAAIEQMRKLPYYHGFGHKTTAPVVELAEKLKSMSPVPVGKVFFAEGGSGANDTLIKLVWYYNNALGRPQKKTILSRVKGYHGVTVATASLTGLPANHRDFDLPIAGIKHVDCPHYYRFAEPGESEADFVARLARNLENFIQSEGPDTVAAFIAEPVMGAGGVILPPENYFPAIQAVLKKYDILSAADEVICGFGRTGRLWGAERFGYKPDFVTCAKQMSSAYLPISAVLVPEHVYSAIRDNSGKIGTFGHGFTYGGHPVAAAVALRALQLYEERDIYGHVNRVSPRFLAHLKRLGEHPLVGEARGTGLIGAAELVADKATKRSFAPTAGVGAACMAFAQEEGLIIRAMAGDVIGFCPPMIIAESEIDALFDRFERALERTEAWVAQQGLRKAA